MLVEAWRKRNQRWAAQHLTPAKSELFQRRWNRISRFSLLSFSLLAGVAFALCFQLVVVVMNIVMGNFQQAAHAFGEKFAFSVFVINTLPEALLTGIFIAGTYYCCLREYAKLQPGKAA